MLLVSVCGLAGVILWVKPGAWELWGGDTAGEAGARAKEKNDAAQESDLAAGSHARVRERPPSPDKTQRQLRNLLAEQLGLKGLDFDKVTAFRGALDRMETDELLDVLKELEASDASKSDKISFSGYIAGALARRDPRLALDTFIGRITNSPQAVLGQLGIIYKGWAYADASAAAEWFDRQAADGALAPVTGAGKMTIDPRVFFESQLIRSQAALDPVAAAERFASMPAEMRGKMLSEDWFGISSPAKVKSVADFLRDHYEDGTSALVKASSARIREGDFGDVAAFLEVLDPAPDERPALVSEAVRVRVMGREELLITPEDAREWILKQVSPQDAGRLTGTMLGQMMEWHEFPEMSRLALRYRDESGSDEVLVAFLKSASKGSKEEILKLAGEISDPVTREELKARFAE